LEEAIFPLIIYPHKSIFQLVVIPSQHNKLFKKTPSLLEEVMKETSQNGLLRPLRAILILWDSSYPPPGPRFLEQFCPRFAI
jgi:hypothetical protein